MEKYCVVDVPEHGRLFTSREIAELLGVSQCQIYFIIRKHNLSYTLEKKKCLFDYPTYKQIKFILESRINKKIKDVEEREEKESEHPLVTDRRFLQLSYFPDVLPKCFQD